ncbi:hypothetical protein T07_3348 [Trichinella nelsoni]|uniref:Uncharacterized protein n=1 Tax=Trichinella nelsoni TaxID=6336 RepID=A0A0V0RAD7_9BILA|nr:hypothetical protein T07_3348 [Trichinella nelsoni]
MQNPHHILRQSGSTGTLNLEELSPPKTVVFWELVLLCFDLTPLKVTDEDL